MGLCECVCLHERAQVCRTSENLAVDKIDLAGSPLMFTQAAVRLLTETIVQKSPRLVIQARSLFFPPSLTLQSEPGRLRTPNRHVYASNLFHVCIFHDAQINLFK